METMVNGVSLHFETCGTGEPVLLVHGFPLSGKLWETVVAALGPDFRLIVPDLRGHGRSEASERTGMETYAGDLVALLDHLGEARPVVLVGLSMGGYVAFELLRSHPERVRALVLANTRAAADTDEQRRTRLETAARVRREGSGVVAESMLDKLFAEGADHELRSRWHAIMAATPPAGAAAALEAMARRPDSLDTLRAFAGPTLIVAGADDAIVPRAEAEAMERAARDAELEVLPGAGHLTPVEQPERFTAALRRFLQRLPPLTGL